MADISHHQFIDLLKKSKVVDPKKLQPWLVKTKKIESARKLAKSLVQNKLLTTWQAKFLLSGRYRLRIGNYFLLSRLKRDELGARYLAVHASLKRKVELQIFSRDLTSDTQRWKHMIQKASLVAKLDHPALVHVYDIDHDDDRYFLVVEHVIGRPLDVQKEIFTTPQIGNLILQCAEGIQVAHENNVVHGTIDQADVLLTDKGTVKLQNLTVSPMRNSNSDAPQAESSADYTALAVLGEKMLKGNPGADGGPGVGLATIFELMKANGPSGVEKLKRWVEVTPDTAPKAAVTKSGANPIFSPAPGNRSGIDLSKTASSSIDIGAREDSAPSATSSASIIQAAWASPPFLISMAVGIVMFFGIVGYGVYNVFWVKPAQEVAKVAQAEKDDLSAKKKAAYNAKEKKDFEAREAKKKRSGNGARKGKQSKNGKAASAKNSVKNRTQKETPAKNKHKKPKVDDPQQRPNNIKPNVAQASGTMPEKDQPAEEQPVETKSAEPSGGGVLDLFGGGSTQTKAATGNEIAGGANTANPGGVPPLITDPNNLQKLNGVGPAVDKALRTAKVRSYDQISKMSPAQLDEVMEKGGTNKLGEDKWKEIIAEATPLAEVALNEAADPFRKVPAIFNLPPIDSTKPVTLTKFLIPSNYSLKTELISPDGVSPRRIYFDLTSSSSSKEQTWTVTVKKNKTASQSSDIATFTKTFEAFNFVWLPGAAKDKSAGYLRNCMVRLSTPDGKSSLSKLRKPMTVRSLRLSEDNFFDSVKVEIEGIPDFDRVKIQLGALENKQRSVEVIDPSCTFDSPAVVALRRRETNGQFLTMQVFAERSGGGIKLTAGFVFNGVLLKSSDQLSGIKSQLNAVAAGVMQRLKAKPSDRNLKKQETAARGNLKRMDEYMEAIEWLFKGGGGVGEPINFDITADFDDGRVLLVKSDKNMLDPDKKKKK